MVTINILPRSFKSQFGSLPIRPDDEIARKLAMLVQGECGSLGVDQTAAKFGFSRQRYFQLRALFLEKGAAALLSAKRGPKSKHRRSQEVVCQIIRHRFLDPDASTAVIAQKLRQCQFPISKRTVDRVIAYYGLQKKTLRVAPSQRASVSGHRSNPPKKSSRKR